VLGTTADEEMAKLTEALISGRERALAPYGSALVEAAGNSHTLGERLAALTSTAATTETATDNATDAMNRFRDSIDDAKRTIASAATNEFMRLSELASPIGDAADKTEEWNRTLVALGETAGNIGVRVLNGVGAIVSGVGLMGASIVSVVSAAGEAARHVTEGRASMSAAFEAEMRAADAGITGDVARYFQARVAALNALSDETNGRTSAAAPAVGPRVDMTFSAEEAAGAAANDNARSRRGGSASRSRGTQTDSATEQMRLAREENQRRTTYRSSADTRLAEMSAADDAITTKREESQGANSGNAEDRFAAFSSDRNAQRIADRERRSFEQRYEHARTFTERWEDLHQRQVSATEEAAGAMDNALGALGSSLAKHFESIVKGQETVGEALKGILTDTLDAIAKESFTKGGFYAAEAIAKLVMYDFPGAATAAAASAAYFAAGATATGLGAAVSGGGSAPAAPAGGGSAPRSERTSGAANDNASASGQTVVNHYYAPVIGGRTATNAEVGAGMNRYTDATERRQARARG
jgi:hypothetical protein